MYQKIMVPLDGSELAECVLPHVETLAKALGVESVILVRVVEPFSLTPVRGDPEFTEEQVEEIDARSTAVARDYLDRLASRLDYGRVNIKTEVLSGKAAETLADYAAKHGVDLIIMATHGRSGISRWVLGSVADRLLRSSHVPVLMVRAPGCTGHA
ncbi:MAG TPA: universal stress protein [Dehalococcoidia bacterium]|jgi:nucleotide-binding universal stress UspA family protein|nr:universal stress protein [Dehalococcoidia bacterium]